VPTPEEDAVREARRERRVRESQERQDETIYALEESRLQRELIRLQREDRSAEHRQRALRLAFVAVAVFALGAFGLGVALVVFGMENTNLSFATLGVVVVLVTLLASGAGGWLIRAPGGFEVRSAQHAVAERAASPLPPAEDDEPRLLAAWDDEPLLDDEVIGDETRVDRRLPDGGP
jgi:uncharacterized membrane protein YqjE